MKHVKNVPLKAMAASHRTAGCAALGGVLLALVPGAIGAVQAPAPTAPPPATGTGIVSGVITDSATTRPIAGAIVTLSRPGQTQTQVLRQITDATGRFVFTRLPASNRYSLAVTKPGYFDGAFGRDAAGLGTRLIGLEEGGWFGDANVAMRRPATISGTIVDEFNQPVVNAYVRLVRRFVLAGQWQHAAGLVTRTDDRGMYRIAGLTAGTYLVFVPSVQGTVLPTTAVTGPGLPVDASHRLVLGTYPAPPPVGVGRPRVYPPLFYPGAPSIKEAGIIELDFGQERAGVDLRLRPVPASRVSGRLEGTTERTPGMALRLLPIGSEGLGFGHEAATTVASPNGTFTFLHVPEGGYTLVASHSGMEYSSSSGSLPRRLPDPAGYQSNVGGGASLATLGPGLGYVFHEARNPDASFGRAAVSVGARDVTDVVVTLRRGVSISGRFIWESGKLQLGGASGGGPGSTPPSLNRVPAFAEPADGNPALGLPQSDRFAEGGDSNTFLVAGLQAGEYFLRFRGLPAVKSIISGGRDYTYVPFDGSAGRDFDDVVVTVTDKVATITGLVRDAKKNLAPETAVICFPVEPVLWKHFGFTPPKLKSVAVTTDGRFEIGDLPAGEYYLIAVERARALAWQEPGFLDKASADAVRVKLDWGDSRAVDLVLRTGR